MPNLVAGMTSDCHLQVSNWVKYPTLAFDSYYSFEQIIRCCLKYSLPLFLAGDIFNRKNVDPHTLGFAFDQLSHMQQAELPVWFTQGQHEFSSTRPWLSCHPWPLHLHGKMIVLKDINFYGLDFMPQERCQTELAKIPSIAHVLVAHQVWLERMGEKSNPEASFADVPHVRMVLTGDFHGHGVKVYPGKTGQQMLVASPGSTYLKTINEDSNKYFFVLQDDLSVRSVRLDTRPVVRAQVFDAAQLEDLIQQLVEMKFTVQDERIAKPIWHVEYLLSIPNAMQRLEAVAGDRAHLFLKPKATVSEMTKPPEDTNDESPNLDTRGSLEVHLPSVTPPESKTYATSLRLLRSDDLLATLNQMTVEVLSTPDDEELPAGAVNGDRVAGTLEPRELGSFCMSEVQGDASNVQGSTD